DGPGTEREQRRQRIGAVDRVEGRERAVEGPVATADGEDLDPALVAFARRVPHRLERRRHPHEPILAEGVCDPRTDLGGPVAVLARPGVEDDPDAAHYAAGRAAASCPHAAWMSAPRLSRIVVLSPPSRRMAWKRRMRGRGLGAYGAPGNGLKGIRFTFARNVRSRPSRRRASASVSFVPSSITYSKVMRRRRARGTWRQAASTAAIG